MGSKTTSQSNQSSSFTPPPSVLAGYQAVTQQAQNVAATPYSAYSGPLVAGINSQQNTGIGAVNNASGIQNPANNAAAGLTGASAAAIDPSQVNSAAISQYESPYQSDVINATEAEIQNQNQQQAAALQGNTISSGAFGGDRAGIGQAALAGQQDIANNATLANLNNQNYSQALGEANTQQGVTLGAQQNTAARQLAAGSQFNQLGQTAQTEALNEANAQTNAGTLQQTTQQAQDTADYNQFLQQQAYPFETTGWLANIVEGIGSQSGGSSTGQTTTQGGSGASQIAGGLLGLASFLARGGRVPHRAPGGPVSGGIYVPQVFDPTEGAPTGPGGGGIVPASTSGRLPIGHTMPTQGAPAPIAPPTPQQQAQSVSQMGNAVKGVGNAFENSSLGDQFNDSIQDAQIDVANGVSADGSGVLAGGADLGLGGIGMMARGGEVGRAHFFNGGTAGSWNNQPAPAPTKATPPTPVGNARPANAPSYSVFPQQMSDGSWTTTQNLSQGIAPLGSFAKGGIVGRPHYDDGGVVPIDPLTISTPESLLLDAASPPTGLAAVAQLPAPKMGAQAPPDYSNQMPAPNVAQETDAAKLGLASQLPAPQMTENGPPIPIPPVRPPDLDAAPSGIAPPMGISPAESPRAVATSAPGNNPGNLVDNSWTQSLPGYAGAKGRFATFFTPEQGAAALDRNLQSYGAQGIGTPLQITSKWAPKGDGKNDPVAYASVIAKNLGIGVNDPVNLSDPATRVNIGQSIALVEHGATAPSTAMAYDGTTGRGGGIVNAPASQAINAAAAPPAGIAAPSVQTSSPQFPDNVSTPESGRTGLFGLNLSPETRQLMLSAGAGIMGGTSMNPWTNIGQGITSGIAATRQNQNLSSEAALRNTQTQGAQIENQMKATQLKLMMDALNGHVDSASSAANVAAPSPTTPTITKPTVAGATPSTPPKQVDPNFDPVALRALSDRLSLGGPMLKDRADRAATQAAAIMNGDQQVRFTDGSVGYYPGVAEAKAKQAEAVAAAQESAKVPAALAQKAGEQGLQTQTAAKTAAYADAESGQHMLSQATAMKDLMFDPKTGKTNINSGPMGPYIARTAALLEQAGVSPGVVKSLTGTNPDNAQELEKLRTSLGSESARADLPGSQVRVAEFQRYLQSVPSSDILPTAIKFMLDNAIIPKAQQQIGAYETVKNMDPLQANIQDELFEYRKNNPWYKETGSTAKTGQSAAAGQGASAAATAPAASGHTLAEVQAEIARRSAARQQAAGGT